jgi:hypothetical protein
MRPYIHLIHHTSYLIHKKDSTMKKLLLTLTGVSAIMTALMAQAPDLTGCVGKGYTLTNAKPAAGAEPITYAWVENDVAVPGAYDAELIVAEGQAVAGDYTYVRTASNADCSLVSSNAYTVRVLPAGAAGETPDATCGCVEGATDCSGTCTTSGTYTTPDGACAGCHLAYMRQWDQCGNLLSSTYSTTESTCTTPNYTACDGACINCTTAYLQEHDACGAVVRSNVGTCGSSSCSNPPTLSSCMSNPVAIGHDENVSWEAALALCKQSACSNGYRYINAQSSGTVWLICYRCQN